MDRRALVIVIAALAALVIPAEAARAETRTEERVYVASAATDQVAVVDAAANVVVGHVAVGREPHQVLATAGGRRL